MRRMHFVIFDECHMAGEAVVDGKTVYLMDQMLSVLIGRVSFSSKDDLHGPPLIQHQSFDAARSWNSSEARLYPVNRRANPIVMRQDRAVFPSRSLDADPRIDRPTIARAFSRKGEELSFQQHVNIPDFFVWYVGDAIPERNIVVPVHPLGPKVSFKQKTQFLRDPCRSMNAVCDRRNREFCLQANPAKRLATSAESPGRAGD